MIEIRQGAARMPLWLLFLLFEIAQIKVAHDLRLVALEMVCALFAIFALFRIFVIARNSQWLTKICA